MKLVCLSILALLTGFGAGAQTFTMNAGDTANVNACNTYTAYNTVKNETGAKIRLQWKVIENTYPADWFLTLGICDNRTCATGASINVGVVNETLDYDPGAGDFHIMGDLAGTATAGPYVVRVRLNNKAVPTDTAIATFVVGKCFMPNSVTAINAPTVNMQVYPNPAAATMNVHYEGATDVSEIAIYNMMGMRVSTCQARANSTTINVENMPAGTYLIRLLNEKDEVVASQRITRQ